MDSATETKGGSVSRYTPVALTNSTLEGSEQHLYSFKVEPYYKDLFRYENSLATYTLHLTSNRLIVEPDIRRGNQDSIYSALANTHLGYGSSSLRFKWRKANENMSLLKYACISLSYDDFEKIELFDKNLVRVILRPNLQNRNTKIFEELGLRIFKPDIIKDSSSGLRDAACQDWKQTLYMMYKKTIETDWIKAFSEIQEQQIIVTDDFIAILRELSLR